MRTLDDAALGSEAIVITPEQIQLILQAEQWLVRNGWEPHHIRGWSNASRSFGTQDGCNGLWIRERRNGYWDSSGERHPVRSVLTAIGILVNEGILPAAFSPHVRDTLSDFADALDRAADRMDRENDDKTSRAGWTAQDRLLEFARAEGFRKAAHVAREHAPSVVLT